MNYSLQQPQIIPRSFAHLVINARDIRKNLLKLKIDKPEIRIVYFGTPKFSAYILEKLIEWCQNPSAVPGASVLPQGVKLPEPRFVIQAVVTSPDKLVGRQQKISASLVSLVATKYRLPTLKPEKLDEDFIQNHFSLLESDLFIVASFGKILPQALLEIPKFGSINVHGSLLPKYRGASPIQQAILNGDNKTGVTIMLMEEKLDSGPILATEEIDISKQDTFETLSTKIAQEATPLLIKTIQLVVDGKIKPRGQNHALATYCYQIKKQDGYFDIESPPSPEKLDRMIRAYFPWPTAWTRWKGKIVKFYPEGFVQMEGKNKVKLVDFLNGHPDFPIKDL